MNISVDFDNFLIGLSNGQDLTPVKIDYTPRVILMAVVFAILALGGFALSFTIDRA